MMQDRNFNGQSAACDGESSLYSFYIMRSYGPGLKIKLISTNKDSSDTTRPCCNNNKQKIPKLYYFIYCLATLILLLPFTILTHY